MQSKITGGPVTYLFTAKILSKYDVRFYRCNETGFVQTEEVHWLGEAYASAITKLDLGLVQRNVELADRIHPILYRHFNHQGQFLDYAGGYGMFTRLMRNKGFDYYHTDQYCQNLFAGNLEMNNADSTKSFELMTAFEVFEHLENPAEELAEYFKLSDNLLFSTVLLPDPIPQPGEWWYYSLETGQHISFFTIKSLQYLAQKCNKHFYTDGKGLHLFSSQKLKRNPFAKTFAEGFFHFFNKMERKYNGKKPSLLDHDIEVARQKLNQHAGI